MEQSYYTQVSKAIGWDEGLQPYPTLERANELLKLVEDSNKLAFVEVFRFQRFARLARDEKELEISNVMFKAFQEGTKIFQNI